MKCMHIGCGKRAATQPVIYVRAFKDDDGYVLPVHLYVCDDHAQDMTVEYLVPDEIWSAIEEGAVQGDLPLPQRLLTEILFSRLELH